MGTYLHKESRDLTINELGISVFKKLKNYVHKEKESRDFLSTFKSKNNSLINVTEFLILVKKNRNSRKFYKVLLI